MARDESYTPTWVVNAVKEVVGDIALDPTGNGQGLIAYSEITQEQNTFTTDWTPYLSESDTVFMNPPYSKGSTFVDELWKYLDLGVVDVAITLTLPGLLHNKSSAWMFSSAYCHAIAFPCGRINYENNGDSNPRDALFALWCGSDCDWGAEATGLFAYTFSRLKSPTGSGSRVNGCLVAYPHETSSPDHQHRQLGLLD
jgi:hypothetical protein